jgi:8-oxo-dGTP diphosphatase
VGFVRTATLISAPLDAVFDTALARAERIALPGVVALQVVAEDRPHQFAAMQRAGRWRSLRRHCRFAATGAGTLVTDEVEWVTPLGRLGSLADIAVLRRRMLRALVTRTAELRHAAPHAVTGPAPATAGRVVVAAALLDGAGRVLAAQRSRPPELAGRWEFAGGKVEPGESDTAALVRECREELGVEIEPIARLGRDLPAGGGGVLRAWTAHIVAGEPRPLEHLALRWLTADQLTDVDWLPGDRPLLAPLRSQLAGGPGPGR